MSWIAFTLFASLMQVIRTAGQKRLAESINVWTVTYVRFIFGLPFVIALVAVIHSDYNLLQVNTHFVIFVTVAAFSQWLASYFSVLLLGRRNFATGTTLVKSEAIFTALIGAVIFFEHLSYWAWLAIVLNVVGLVLASIHKQGVDFGAIVNKIDSKSACLGLAAGVLFATASVCIRQASLSMEGVDSGFSRGVFILLVVLSIQVVLSFVMIFWRRPIAIKEMISNAPSCLFIGVTSMLGSIGWFVAYALQNAAHVKVLGQIEFVLLGLITLFYFKEKITANEWLAMLLIVLSIIILFLS